MEKHHKVDLHLTSKQKSKFMKKKAFQMTADQCSSGPKYIDRIKARICSDTLYAFRDIVYGF